MSINDEVKRRIVELIQQSQKLTIENEFGTINNNEQSNLCKGWVVAAMNIISLACEGTNSLYLKLSSEIAGKEYGFTVHKQVGELAEVLRHLLVDIEKGLVCSVYFQAQAVAFDDFLDHAIEYQKKSLKNEAGVIAGVVFEDTIRKICEKNNIPQVGRKLDELISELSSKSIIPPVKAKRARVSAHVRTKATHAQWIEFELSDVKETIEFTKELIHEKL